jgi:hypothetical protein
MSVHRIVLLAFLVEPPDGYQASHMNGRPSDNRHTNLAWEPNTMNVRRQVPDGTRASGERPCGEGHHATTLTTDEVRAMRREYAAGKTSHGKLALYYGITRQALSSTVSRRTWAHVEP